MKNKLALAGLLFFLTVLAYYFLLPLEEFEYAISVDITANEKEVGFDATNTSFVFGILPQGASATRQFSVQTDVKRRIGVSMEGQIKGWLAASKNNFNLVGKETLSLGIKVPKNAPAGHYEGKLKVRTYRTL